MTISSSITARQDVIAVPGAATTTTCNVLVVVRHPSASEPTIALACNGVTYANADVEGGALTQYGTDHADGSTQGPMWAGVIIVTGLSAFTQYSFTITDSTNGTSNTGTLMTAPSATDDFTLFCGTCYRNTKQSIPNGMFSFIYNYVQSGTGLPVAAYMHVDDIWYVADSLVLDDMTGGTGLSTDGGNNVPGNETNPGTSSYQYDWAVGYLCGFGMLGPTGDFSPQADEYNIYASRGEHKVWCSKNLNFMAQWGDHEILNDVGWDTPFSGTGAAPGATPAAALWDATFGTSGLMTGASAQSADASARHWKHTLGPIRIIAPDGLSNATPATIVGQKRIVTAATSAISTTGNPTTVTIDSTEYADGATVSFAGVTTTPDDITASSYTLTKVSDTQFTIAANVTAAADPAGTATIDHTNINGAALAVLNYANPPLVTGANLYGDNQVLDILDALDTDDAFKLLLMDKGIKYPVELGGDSSGVFAEINTGEQHPIKNHAATMYSNLVTKDAAHAGGQESVMLNRKTNGASGTTFVITGDHHNNTIYRNHAASPGAGDLAEEIVSINCGTMNGSGNHPYDSSLVVGTATAQECTPLHLSGQQAGGGENLWCIQLEVYGSRSPKEVHVKCIDENEAVTFHKKFIQYRGNLMWNADTEVAHIAPVSADE